MCNTSFSLTYQSIIASHTYIEYISCMIKWMRYWVLGMINFSRRICDMSWWNHDSNLAIDAFIIVFLDSKIDYLCSLIQTSGSYSRSLGRSDLIIPSRYNLMCIVELWNLNLLSQVTYIFLLFPNKYENITYKASYTTERKTCLLNILLKNVSTWIG
jgi:hypothetical protein